MIHIVPSISKQKTFFIINKTYSIANNYYWIRHVDCEKDGSIINIQKNTSLLCLADVPPPAITSRANTFPPVSTASWAINFMTENPISYEDGWFLVNTKTEKYCNGYSSQETTVWGNDELCMKSRQLVAVF